MSKKTSGTPITKLARIGSVDTGMRNLEAVKWQWDLDESLLMESIVSAFASTAIDDELKSRSEPGHVCDRKELPVETEISFGFYGLRTVN